MLNRIRTHWSKISTGLLLATLLGVGGVKLHERLGGDCCGLGLACCYPGSPCCHHDDKAHPLALR